MNCVVAQFVSPGVGYINFDWNQNRFCYVGNVIDCIYFLIAENVDGIRKKRAKCLGDTLFKKQRDGK